MPNRCHVRNLLVYIDARAYGIGTPMKIPFIILQIVKFDVFHNYLLVKYTTE